MSSRKVVYRIRAAGRGAGLATEAASKLELYFPLLQAAKRALRLTKTREKLIKLDHRSARTGELTVLLNPTDRLRNLVLALRALDREVVRVKKSHAARQDRRAAHKRPEKLK